MLCKDCEHFKILYEPYKICGELIDWGKAVCEKHELETDFITHKKFETLSSIEGGIKNDKTRMC